MLMHLQADAVSGAMDEVLAVARVLNDLARGAVELTHGQTRAHGGASGLIGAAAHVVDALLLIGGGLEEHGARHVAAIAFVHQAHIQDHRVASLQAGLVVVVVRLRAVRAEAADGREAAALAADRLRVLQVQLLQLQFRHALSKARDGAPDRLVVHAGGLTHQRNLLRILAHPRIVHRCAAHHRNHPRQRLHQPDRELARPGLVHAQLARLDSRRQQRNRILRVVELRKRHVHIAVQRKQTVCKQFDFAVCVQIKSEHAFAGRDHGAGEIVHR